MNRELPIEVSTAKVEALCRKWQITELSLFGSVLRTDFCPDSDVDVLVTFSPGARPGWLSRRELLAELQDLFGRRVDCVDRQLLDADANYLRRRAIQDSAVVLHGP